MSRKRDQLIQTGEALFVKHGMRRVTVEEICRQAGVSKPTFYVYFENKEALARRIDELWIEEALEQIDEIEDADVPFPEKMRQILAVKQELAARPGPEFLEDLIQLDIDLSHAFRRVMHFLVQGQQDRILIGFIEAGEHMVRTTVYDVDSQQDGHRCSERYQVDPAGLTSWSGFTGLLFRGLHGLLKPGSKSILIPFVQLIPDQFPDR